MSLDETTEKLYRAADAATLLGLLPLIQSQMARIKSEMRIFESSLEQSADSDAAIAELYGESLARLHARIGDDPKGRDALQSVRDSLAAALAKLHANDEDQAAWARELFKHLIELTDRERWIVNEMKRRGYLPTLPGEE